MPKGSKVHGASVLCRIAAGGSAAKPASEAILSYTESKLW
jgi:hypothetical protein